MSEWRKESTMRRLYHDEGLNQYEMADRLGCSQNTIGRWLDRLGIEKRTDGRDDAWNDRQVLYELYVEQGLSTWEIGERLGCAQSTVRYWLNKHGIEARQSDRDRHPMFYTEPFRDGGYERMKTIDGSFVHHRLLATLFVDDVHELRDCDVHHCNHIPWDNRLSNLKVMDAHEHRSMHGSQSR